MKSQHQSDEMGINLRKVPHDMLGSEGDNTHSSECDYEKSNQVSEQLDHEPNKTIVLDEGIDVPKKVHNFHFVKFWPHQEPSSESDIKKAENLIRKLNQDELLIKKRLEKRRNQRWEFCHALGRLQLQGEDPGLNLLYAISGWKGRELERLQEVLDKLCFANKAYQARAAESCLLSGDKLDNHRLQFQMLHRCTSLAEENQLMRDIKAIQKRGGDHMCSTISLEELDWGAYFKYLEDYHAKKVIGLANRDRNRKEIKQIKLRADKCVYKNAVKGQIWNSFGLKQAVIDKLKIIGNDMDMLKKKQSEVEDIFSCIQKKVRVLNKNIDSLNKQWSDIQERKKEACKSLHKLRQQYGKANVHCYQNRFLLRKAQVLAGKKNVAALEELCHTEGEKFMSQWNKSKAFRDDYTDRVSCHHSAKNN